MLHPSQYFLSKMCLSLCGRRSEPILRKRYDFSELCHQPKGPILKWYRPQFSLGSTVCIMWPEVTPHICVFKIILFQWKMDLHPAITLNWSNTVVSKVKCFSDINRQLRETQHGLILCPYPWLTLWLWHKLQSCQCLSFLPWKCVG